MVAGTVLAGYTSVDELARALNISPKTLTRTLSGEREIKDSEMEALPGVLGVPMSFLRHGFESEATRTQQAEEVAGALETILGELQGLRRDLGVERRDPPPPAAAGGAH